MPETPRLPQAPLQRRIAQLALDLASKLAEKALPASSGSVLDACAALLLDDGRQFLRDSLAATLQQQADQANKKGGPPVPVRADTPAAAREPARGSS
jgi:hypothetical protein